MNMSSAIDSSAAWESEFRARFGSTGAPDAPAERERLIQMCQELLAERDQLRLKLARLQEAHDVYYRAFGALMKRELAKLCVDLDLETLRKETAGRMSFQELVAQSEAEATQ
jgi:hypothetical protein